MLLLILELGIGSLVDNIVGTMSSNSKNMLKKKIQEKRRKVKFCID